MLFPSVYCFCCLQDGAGDEATGDGETEDRRGDAQTNGEREDGGTSQDAPRGKGDRREGGPSVQVGGLGPVYTKRQLQLCDDGSDSAPIENNGVAPGWGCNPFFQVTPIVSPVSLQSCRSVHADAWCKRALSHCFERPAQGVS